MSLREKLSDMLMGVAVIGALVSAGGIALTIGGLLLSEHNLTGLGLGMIVGGTVTYVAILNKIQHDKS